MKYVADDGKEFDSENICKIYEKLSKKKPDPVVTKVNSVIINVEMSDGLSHSIIYQNIKNGGEINIERNISDNPYVRNDTCKATINFDYLYGSMIILLNYLLIQVRLYIVIHHIKEQNNTQMQHLLIIQSFGTQ